MKIILVRHGMTFGNSLKRYIGVTDEPLSEAGKASLNDIEKKFDVKKVYITSLLRTAQTAEILFPNAKKIVIKDLSEMDFGEFENKNYMELSENKDYIKWVNENCEGTCPNGEKKADFIKRITKAFEKTVDEEIKKQEKELFFVVHNGTIMALRECFESPQISFFESGIKNGEYITFYTDKDMWKYKKMRRMAL